MTEGAVANRKRRPVRGSAARERRGPRRRRTPPTARSRPPHPNRPLETWQRTESNRSEVPKALRADRERVEKRMEEPRTQDGELFLLVLPNGSALSCRRPCATWPERRTPRARATVPRRPAPTNLCTPRTPAVSCSAWLGSPNRPRHLRGPAQRGCGRCTATGTASSGPAARGAPPNQAAVRTPRGLRCLRPGGPRSRPAAHTPNPRRRPPGTPPRMGRLGREARPIAPRSTKTRLPARQTLEPREKDRRSGARADRPPEGEPVNAPQAVRATDRAAHRRPAEPASRSTPARADRLRDKATIVAP